MKKLFIALITITLANIGAYADQTREEATDSIRQIYNRAREGSATDQYEVGQWHFNGRHVEQNDATALAWWARAAQQNHPEATAKMAMCYRIGRGTTADSTRAAGLYIRSIRLGNEPLVELLDSVADAGNVFAQTLMAECYGKGISVRRNRQRQQDLLTSAANAGSVNSMTILGSILLSQRNQDDAFAWFCRADSAGDINAKYWKGRMTLEGWGTEQSDTLGYEIILSAAQLDHENAMIDLAECYIDGRGTAASPQLAVSYLKKASGKGKSKADWMLGKLYAEGRSIDADYGRAAHYFGRAASNNYGRSFAKYINDSIPGSPFAVYLEGVRLKNAGQLDSAMNVFKQLERIDVNAGKFMQGILLTDSAYSACKPNKGFKLIKEAAETSIQSRSAMALLMLRGVGTEVDSVRALDLLHTIAANGYGPVQCQLGNMYFAGAYVPKNVQTAVQYYLEAEATGQLTPSAAQNLARCYEEGLGGLTADTQRAEAIREANHGPYIDNLVRLTQSRR